jgi:hypothetical protein
MHNDPVVGKNAVEIHHQGFDRIGKTSHFLVLALGGNPHFGDLEIHRIVNFQAALGRHTVQGCPPEKAVTGFQKSGDAHDINCPGLQVLWLAFLAQGTHCFVMVDPDRIWLALGVQSWLP